MPNLHILPEMGILFEDKHCTVRLLQEDNQSDAIEWWWEEWNDGTIFVISYNPAGYPGLVVHRITGADAQVELNKMLSEGWVVTRRGKPEFLKVPHVSKYE